jgi:multiple sugar transport system ATP-binding protein
MARLELDHVTKVFEDGEDEIVAVDDVSLEIPDEEFLVLVGPSGCGKSTMLRMIAGLETPTEGTIRLGEADITDVKPQERDIALVFQSYALYPHKTVFGNISFGLEQSTDLSKAEIRDRVEEATEMMGISDLLDRTPDELSGGQQQRVALGRAIVRNPDAFLMDEPLSNLDAKLRAEMRTELQRLQDTLGVTTMYVTHDQTEAMTMGDHIAVLNAGELQQVGTPLECYHRPNNRFVAGFIGDPSMNFFRGSVVGDAFECESFAFPLSEETSSALEEGMEVTLGIRPEDVRVGTEAETETDHVFDAEVRVVEPQGDENTIHLRFDSGEEFVATTFGSPSVAEGEQVPVAFPEAAIHLFDSTSGDAVKNREIADTGTIEGMLPD